MPDPEILLHNTSNQHIAVELNTVQRITENIARVEGVNFGAINVIFMNTKEHTSLNIKYLGHEYETDILTFDISDPININADIYINVDVAQSNANEYNNEVTHEYYRLCIHGILHMSGYNDQTTEEKKLMTKKEDYYLKVSCET